MSFARPKLIPWLFFLSAMALTLALGTWQIARLQWKTDLIAHIERAKTEAPLPALPANDQLAAHEFTRVALAGTWVPGVEFHVTPRYYKDKLGYHLFVPLKLADGRIVLINRGWVPADRKNPETRPESIAKGMASLVGMIRIGQDRNYFTPPSQPQKNIWFGRDVTQMAETENLQNLAPVTVDAIGTPDATRLPIPFDGEIRLYNQHLSYVFTWYGIALAVLVIFLVYHYKRPDEVSLHTRDSTRP
ncbi:MAG: SURF1 family protein [Alphaproteobacteria bacterium]